MSDNHDDEIEMVGDETVEIDETQEAAANESPSEDAEKYKKDYLYLLAEFENYKKNAIKERSQLIKYGNERLMLELFEVIDNFDRAIEMEVGSDNLDSFKQGIQLIHGELVSSLSKFGVSMSNPVGQPFDPTEHEALSSEATGDMPAGHVFRVFKKAYHLHDKLIRPAQVVVAKEPESGTENPSESS